MVNLIDEIILCRNEQHEIGHVYTQFCNTLTVLMEQVSEIYIITKTFKKEA